MWARVYEWVLLLVIFGWWPQSCIIRWIKYNRQLVIILQQQRLVSTFTLSLVDKLTFDKLIDKYIHVQHVQNNSILHCTLISLCTKPRCISKQHILRSVLPLKERIFRARIKNCISLIWINCSGGKKLIRWIYVEKIWERIKQINRSVTIVSTHTQKKHTIIFRYTHTNVVRFMHSWWQHKKNEKTKRENKKKNSFMCGVYLVFVYRIHTICHRSPEHFNTNTYAALSQIWYSCIVTELT